MRVLKQWPMYLFGRILPATIGFLAIALYTHKVDPASFGIYSLLLAISAFVGHTSFAWSRTAVLRMLGSLDEPDVPDFLSTVVAIFLVASLVVALIIAIALRLILPSASVFLVALTALAAISYGWFELNIVVCQTRLMLKTYGILQASRAVFALLGTLSLLGATGHVESLLGGYVIGNCVALVTLYNFRAMVRGKPRSLIFQRIFDFGWPSVVASLAGVSVTFQKLLLQSFGGAAALGIYSVANDFAGQSVGLLIGTAAIAGQPLAFRARDGGEPDALHRQLLENARLICFVAIGASVGLAALAQPIARICFGAQFHANAWQLISLASATALLGGLRASIFEQGFEIVFHTRPIAVLTWIRVLIYLPLSAVCIRFQGSIGAGEAALVTEMIALIITAAWVRKFIAMPIPWGGLLHMAFAALAMAICVQFTPLRNQPIGLAIAVFVGAAVYGILYWIFYAPKLLRTVTRARTSVD